MHETRTYVLLNIQNFCHYPGKGTVCYMKTWIELETTYKPPHGHQAFSKVSFVTFDSAIIETKVLDNQSQFMNCPCGDPNKELNHKEENQK